jgi:hypothetical protein
MHTKSSNLIGRYARKPFYYTYCTFEPTAESQPVTNNSRKLELVVHNRSLTTPNIISPHYHTGE